MAEELEGIVPLFRKAIADIMARFDSVEDFLDDERVALLINGIVEQLEQLGFEVADILGPEVSKAYLEGVAIADEVITPFVGVAVVGGFSPKPHLQAIQNLADDTMEHLMATIRTAQMQLRTDIGDILDGVKKEIASGLIQGNGSNVVKQRLMNHYRQHGLTGFWTKEDTNGVRRRLPLDFYSELVARTVYRDANTKGTVNRCKQGDVNFIKISEHHPACKVCSRYAGKVVALDEGDTRGFPTDIPLPPYHPNCRHTISPYVIDFMTEEEIDQDKKKSKQIKEDPRTKAQKDAYEKEQRIRVKANKEKKEYERIKALLGDDAPKNIGAYRRMKRKKDQKWHDLQNKFATAVTKIDNS